MEFPEVAFAAMHVYLSSPEELERVDLRHWIELGWKRKSHGLSVDFDLEQVRIDLAWHVDKFVQLKSLVSILEATGSKINVDLTIWLGDLHQEILVPHDWLDQGSSPLREIWAEGNPPETSCGSDEVFILTETPMHINASFKGSDSKGRQAFLGREIPIALGMQDEGSALIIELRARSGIAGIVLTSDLLRQIAAGSDGLVIRNQACSSDVSRDDDLDES